jgi:hypothetical protein
MKQALIVWGGWPGHEPEACAHVVAGMLEPHGFDVRLATGADAFADPALNTLDLIVPIVTMSKIEKAQAVALSEAVPAGDGMAGFHGGRFHAFRESTD